MVTTDNARFSRRVTKNVDVAIDCHKNSKINSVGNHLYLAKSFHWCSKPVILDENRLPIQGNRVAYSNIFLSFSI